MRVANLSAPAAFRALHDRGCFVLPNPWDVGSARYLEHLGFKALATTSAGFAFARGLADGAVSLEEMLAHFREIAEAVAIPVNADFLSGFADEPEGVATNVLRCLETGVAGLSIEDNSGRSDHPLYAEELAVARIKAAREAIDTSGREVILTGRCEAYLVGQPDPWRFVLRRLQAYAAAGADCLYAPGVSEAKEVAAIVKAVAPKPVNVLVSGFNSQLAFAELAELGVRRISVGSGLALAAWGKFTRAAREILDSGRFGELSGGMPFAELNALFGKQRDR